MTGRRPAQRSIPLFLLSTLAIALAACTAAAPAGPVPDVGQPAAGTPAPAAPGEDGASADATGVREGALIVYTGRLRLEVSDFRPVLESATRLIVDLGGYVAGSEEQNTTSSQAASVTYRIPAARWAEALAGLRGLGSRVLNEYTESADVTAEVVDLGARVANLQATEAALQQIMTRAGTIDDVLKVQRELSTVRGQIEQLTASRDHLQEQAAFGTLVVHFDSPVVAATVAHEGWQLGAEVDRALADLIRITQGLTSIGIWLAIVALPVLLPLGLVLYLAFRLRRRLSPSAARHHPLGPSM